jgi:predicted protein tyrosine phosphatase
LKLLFICSRNQWRSPTAERIFRSDEHITKSAGTSESARVRVNRSMLMWADLIFVMEKRHKDRLLQSYRQDLDGKRIIVLDIPDEYHYMDTELIEMLQLSVEPYLATR